jgi:quinol monooxygenase YgiN
MPGATIEQYEQVSRALGMRDPDAQAPEGLIWHVAGEKDGTLYVVDAWESAEQFQRLMEQAGPEIAKAGAPPAEPRILPLHNHIPKGQGTQPNLLAILEAEGFSPELYDDVTSRMPAHEGDGSGHPAVSHAAALTDNGMVFVDVWDSRDSLERFMQGEVAAAAGGEMPPMEYRFVPVHNRMVGSVHAST